jgi:uncharacterized membrane protein YccF (DUF307 family)
MEHPPVLLPKADHEDQLWDEMWSIMNGKISWTLASLLPPLAFFTLPVKTASFEIAGARDYCFSQPLSVHHCPERVVVRAPGNSC